MCVQMNDWRIVRASSQLMDELSAELRDVTAGHVVPGHVLAADLLVGGHVKLATVADSSRNIWLSKYDVPHRRVCIVGGNQQSVPCPQPLVSENTRTHTHARTHTTV